MKYSVGIAYILWALGGFGALGLHRFYLGKVPTGVLWIATLGLGGVGCVYDFFTLGRQVEDANIHYAYRAGLAGPRPVYISETPQAQTKESMEKLCLRLAKRNGGTVSPG
ncbi:MAG TPA: TM2 domain-containing protein, partial [Spirochaetales bacterium]|nr:TM2 domain-containing protein [Spirochaetales bacterium]